MARIQTLWLPPKGFEENPFGLIIDQSSDREFEMVTPETAERLKLIFGARAVFVTTETLDVA